MEGLVARPGWNSWKVLREHNSKAKKDHKKKNSAKIIAKRKEWQEKRQKADCHDSKEQREDEAAENQEEEKFERSPYHTLPYVAPETWDEATLRERTTSLGFVEYATYDDVEPEWRRRVRASCFPPSEAEAKAFELHKCLRCLPHDMDTGGFFVALLKKVKPLSPDATARMHQMARESRGGIEVEAHLNSNGDKKDDDAGVVNDEVDAVKTEPSEMEQTDDEPIVLNETEATAKEEEEGKAPTGRIGIHHNKKKKENGDLGNEDFIPLDDSIWPPIIEEFGISSDFPKEQYMARASGEAKVLYFIAKSIKEQLIERGIQNRVTVINSGLKAFERCSIAESRNKYRISQEAIQFVLPYMTKRVIVASADDFYKCCAKGFMEFGVYSQEFQDKIGELAPGSFVVLLDGHENDMAKKMFLVMWKRSNAIECFVSKVEMDGIVSKLRALGFGA
jgi:tRNA (cytosine34-C5)-methyltransferase